MIDKERLINTFIELVSVPCVSLNEKAEAELIISKLTKLGLHIFVDDIGTKVDGNTGNVWAYLPANTKNKKRLLFEAHMDSVAPTTGTKVIRKDGVLYSDGTTTLGGDDKVGIAAAIEAMQAIQDNNIPHGEIQLCFTIAEEIGCIGAKNIDPANIKADFGYCLDDGSKPGSVTNYAPRNIVLSYEITGKAAHAGVEPEKGINAIVLAAKAIAAIPNHGRLDENSTLNFDLISGGTAANIVAPKANGVIDIRSLIADEVDIIVNNTKNTMTAAVKEGGGEITFELKESAPAMYVSTDAPVVSLVQKAATELGLPFTANKSGGCTDGNFLCGKGLPCVAVGTGMSKIHTTEEYLEEKDLYDLTCLILKMIELA